MKLIIKTIVCAIFYAIWGGSVTAQDLPKLYAVIGVAGHDALNIRTEPNADAEILGGFVHNASGVEVIALNEDGKWGQVNIGERTGWSAMRFLTPISDEEPVWIGCFGTEPFWGLIMDETGKTSGWSSPESKGKVTDLEPLVTAAVMPRRFGYAGKIEGGEKFQATMTHQICSDGMSDNLYGLSIDLSLTGGGKKSGCCTLQR